MKIETKYDIGQYVWFMRDNKPRRGKILGVQFTNTRGTMTSYYGVGKSYTTETVTYSIELLSEKSYAHYSECSLFPSKEELRNNVFDNY